MHSVRDMIKSMNLQVTDNAEKLMKDIEAQQNQVLIIWVAWFALPPFKRGGGAIFFPNCNKGGGGDFRLLGGGAIFQVSIFGR